MSAEALRVALLARPGVARERLRGVMDEAGVERVLEADPTELELAALLAASPRAVLVALDPATEDVLERFDEVLFDPGVDVIYEEAELAASREGWDVARWQRHLVAKLQRHGDVLPPGREPDEIDAATTAAPVIASEDVAGFEPEPAAPGNAAGLQLETAVSAPHADEPAAGHNPFDPVMAEFDSGLEVDFETEFGTETSLETAFDPAVAEAPELSMSTDVEPAEVDLSASPDPVMEPAAPEVGQATSESVPA